jgi:hypothetical protein
VLQICIYPFHFFKLFSNEALSSSLSSASLPSAF